MNDKPEPKPSSKPDRSNVTAPGQDRDKVKPHEPRPPPGSKPRLVPDPKKDR